MYLKEDTLELNIRGEQFYIYYNYSVVGLTVWIYRGDHYKNDKRELTSICLKPSEIKEGILNTEYILKEDDIPLLNNELKNYRELYQLAVDEFEKLSVLF